MSASPLRVFVSSTARDLPRHRAVVRDHVLDQEWLPVMMEHFHTEPEATVAACAQKVESCDLVILLVAHRRGWVPTRAQGGDGQRSVTAFELEAARRHHIPVRVLLASESWPGNLWEAEQAAREWMRLFRADLNQIGVFFEAGAAAPGEDEPSPKDEFKGKVRQLLLDHRDWLRKKAELAAAGTVLERKLVGAEAVLATLEPLLANAPVSRQACLEAYRRAAPPGWEPAPVLNPAVLPLHCARGLAQAPRQHGDGTFPLLRFVQALTSQLPEHVARRLGQWHDDAAARLAVDRADAASLRAAAPAVPESADSPTYHLLIQVSPSTFRTGHYRVKAWLHGTRDPACLLAGEEDHPREALLGLLDGLREEVARRGLPFERVWVEFLLPRDLLGVDLDQWEVDQDFLRVPLGVEHRVVVRSLERMSRPKGALALRSRWEAYQRRAGQSCRVCRDWPGRDAEDAVAVWLEGEACGGPAVFTRLRDLQAVVCALLGRPPSPAPANPNNDPLNVLLAAGIPVALWQRRPADQPALGTLVHGTPLQSLPDRVWDLRKQAIQAEDDAHAGRHVTLLWDDPSRVSPDFDPALQLRAPQ